MQAATSVLSRSTGPRTSRAFNRTYATMDKAATIKSTVKDNKVVVYSKTYCPYCTRAKGLFQQLQVPTHVIELDQIADGNDWQATLQSLTGQRTVPQVFVGGSFIGGCDDTMAAYNSGKLKQLLAGAGIAI